MAPASVIMSAMWMARALSGAMITALTGCALPSVTGLGADGQVRALSERFLEAVASGDGDVAQTMVGREINAPLVEAGAPWLPAEAYRTADERIGAWEIASVSAGSQVHLVEGTAEIGGSTEDFTLMISAETMLITDADWLVQGGRAAASALIAEGEVVVNGVAAPVRASEEFVVLPGRYRIGIDAGPLVDVEAQELVVSDDLVGHRVPQLTATLTEAGERAVDEETQRVFDECLASPALENDGCPNSREATGATSPVGVQWRIEGSRGVDYAWEDAHDRFRGAYRGSPDAIMIATWTDDGDEREARVPMTTAPRPVVTLRDGTVQVRFSDA
ncbi:hypothetical protein [Naumannella huperziae]